MRKILKTPISVDQFLTVAGLSVLMLMFMLLYTYNKDMKYIEEQKTLWKNEYSKDVTSILRSEKDSTRRVKLKNELKK